MIAAGLTAPVAAAFGIGLQPTTVEMEVDPGDHDIAFAAMDGSPLLSRDVARDKAWTAIAFGRPTTWWADVIAEDPGLAALGSNNRLMPVPGGVPLLVTHDGDQGEGIAGAVGAVCTVLAYSGLAVLPTRTWAAEPE